MAIVESLLIALGTGVAKYLAKEALPKDWQDQIAVELVSLGVRQVTARQEEDPAASAIGKRLKTLYDRSAVAENDKTAVLIEVIRTLGGARTDVQHLVEHDLNPELLRRDLLALRSDTAAHFSTNETALYEQMLSEASQGMVQVASRLEGFATAQARAQLGHQRAMLDQQTVMVNLLQSLAPSLASWLQGPNEQAIRFEREVYRPILVDTLNLLEPFGIAEGDRISDELRLIDTFVEPDLLLTFWEQEPEDFFVIDGEMQTIEASKREKRMPTLNALAGIQRLMVVGTAGSGKSTFLQWLAVCAGQQSFPPALSDWNRLVPFFIRLRDYQGQGFPEPERFVETITTMGRGEMPHDWVREVLRRGDGLVLVDGVDEMRREDRARMLKSMQDLVRLYPLSRFVVTSRPPAVDELTWPAWQIWLRKAGFTEGWLADMHWHQIENLVRRWHDALDKVTTHADNHIKVSRNREGAVKLLQREPTLRRLAATPLLCAMICTLYQRQGDNIVPDRLELYRNCVDMLLWERDRKHQRRKVPALADYHEFQKDHLLRLLSHLAYWMMDEGASAVSQKRVVAQFSDYMPNLGITKEPDHSLGGRAFEYFNERASVWDQPVDGMVEFRHRTFQEYLAATWAMRQDKVGALAQRAANTHWRETIVLAAGSGTPAQSWALLEGIMQRADALQTEPDAWRYLSLLALDCLETCNELPKAKQWQEVVEHARLVFPPHSREEAEMVANGGVYAVDLLSYDPDCPAELAAHCIRALTAIGGERAVNAIASHAGDERQRVQEAIGDAWNQFETNCYADRVLSERSKVAFSATPPTNDELRLLPQLRHLSLNGASVSNLNALVGLSHLTQLTLSSASAWDLSMLTGLTRLTQLNLRNMRVSDLSALAELNHLTKLNLSGTAVSDPSTLAGLTQLTQLSIRSMSIAEVSALAGLTQLSQLDLSFTSVSDLSTLAELTRLTQLDLSYTSVSDLSALAGLNQLKQLAVRGVSIRDLGPLAQLTQLRQLDLGGISVNDLSALAGLNQLTQLNLDLRGTLISDLSALAGLTQLKELHLDLRGTLISDLSALAGLTQLKELHLDLRGTLISDLSALAGLTQLTHLNLCGVSIWDLDVLAGLNQLRHLNLSGVSVRDLSALAKLTQLTHLDLSGMSVRDLSVLATLTRLEQLNLSGTPVQDVSVLVGLSHLTQLDLSFTSVYNLSMLTDLHQLKHLNLRGTLVRDLSVLTGLNQLTHLSLNGVSVRDLSALAELSNLTLLMIDGGRANDAVLSLKLWRQRGVAIYTDYRRQILYRYLPRNL